MFTVKLGTGKTFEATAAEEAYGAVYGGSPRLTLRLEASPAPRGLDWYLGLLEEEGALDKGLPQFADCNFHSLCSPFL
ncbi:hypothetical protein [Acutalibacter sp. JLR.KK004]|uniref:hypothetical protein n=1 Tax=Acutalibacter sp. JLR.KK004 TaxID=3112622 RepID=UPI002FF0A929